MCWASVPSQDEAQKIKNCLSSSLHAGLRIWNRVLRLGSNATEGEVRLSAGGGLREKSERGNNGAGFQASSFSTYELVLYVRRVRLSAHAPCLAMKIRTGDRPPVPSLSLSIPAG